MTPTLLAVLVLGIMGLAFALVCVSTGAREPVLDHSLVIK